MGDPQPPWPDALRLYPVLYQPLNRLLFVSWKLQDKLGESVITCRAFLPRSPWALLCDVSLFCVFCFCSCFSDWRRQHRQAGKRKYSSSHIYDSFPSLSFMDFYILRPMGPCRAKLVMGTLNCLDSGGGAFCREAPQPSSDLWRAHNTQKRSQSLVSPFSLSPVSQLSTELPALSACFQN